MLTALNPGIINAVHRVPDGNVQFYQANYNETALTTNAIREVLSITGSGHLSSHYHNSEAVAMDRIAPFFMMDGVQNSLVPNNMQMLDSAGVVAVGFIQMGKYGLAMTLYNAGLDNYGSYCYGMSDISWKSTMTYSVRHLEAAENAGVQSGTIQYYLQTSSFPLSFLIPEFLKPEQLQLLKNAMRHEYPALQAIIIDKHGCNPDVIGQCGETRITFVLPDGFNTKKSIQHVIDFLTEYAIIHKTITKRVYRDNNDKMELIK